MLFDRMLWKIKTVYVAVNRVYVVHGTMDMVLVLRKNIQMYRASIQLHRHWCGGGRTRTVGRVRKTFEEIELHGK